MPDAGFDYDVERNGHFALGFRVRVVHAGACEALLVVAFQLPFADALPTLRQWPLPLPHQMLTSFTVAVLDASHT